MKPATRNISRASNSTSGIEVSEPVAESFRRLTEKAEILHVSEEEGDDLAPEDDFDVDLHLDTV